MECAIITVDGGVQGVGFRWWATDQARRLGLVGHAHNLADGRVELLAQGELDRIITLIDKVMEEPTTSRRPGWVTDQQIEWRSPVPGLTEFSPY